MLSEQRYDDIKTEWRYLSGEERLEIMMLCLENGIDYLINNQHFEFWPQDREMIENEIEKYSDKFGLTEYELIDIKYSFKQGNYKGGDTIKLVALLARLQEYNELYEKHSDTISQYFFKKNYNIFKCEPRRTDSRIQFLKEQNKIENEDELIEDLTRTNSKFNFKYQAALERKMAELGYEEDYKILASMVKVAPDYAYDKFVEMALQVLYGDEILIRRINEKKEKIYKKIKTESEEKKESPKEVNYKLVTVDIDGKMTTVKVVDDGSAVDLEELALRIAKEQIEKQSLQEKDNSSSKNDMKDEENLIPYIGEIISESSGGNPTHGTRIKIKERSEKAPLDKNAVKRYIKDVKEMGIDCKGYVEWDGGIRASGEDKVFFYIFKCGNYEILEPVGQVGNRTYMLRTEEGKDTLQDLLNGQTSLEDLILEEKAIRVNHRKTSDEQYLWAPTRIISLACMVEEANRRVNNRWSMDKLKEEITQEVSREEISEVIKYVKDLELVQENEKKIPEEKKDFSSQNRRSIIKKLESIEKKYRGSDGERDEI